MMSIPIPIPIPIPMPFAISATGHAPPGSYMLRKLHDVPVPDAVSVWPQTLGWKMVGVVCLLLLAYWLYLTVWGWWQNRYRDEALAAIERIASDPDLNEADHGQALFHILKTVMVYLDHRHAALFGAPFLQQLDCYGRTNPRHTVKARFSRWLGNKTAPSAADPEEGFTNALGEQWMQSLVNPAVTLGASELDALLAKSRQWVKQHDPRLGRDVESATPESNTSTKEAP